MLRADMYQEDAYRLAGDVLATTRTSEDESVTLVEAQDCASAALQEVAEQSPAPVQAVE